MSQKREYVIEKAMNLFWEKGYHATSMRNLQECVDMRPGSIYASFGSKEGLFKESLRHYAKSSLRELEGCVQADLPLAALKRFMRGCLDSEASAAPSDMCMLVKTVSELTEENEDMLSEAKRLLSEVEGGLTRVFERAQLCGEVGAEAEPKVLGRLFQIQFMGIRSYLRANGDVVPVNELIDDVFAGLA